MMQGITVDEYCQKTFNMSFDDYVKKAVAQEMILQAIADKENITKGSFLSLQKTEDILIKIHLLRSMVKTRLLRI